MSELSTVPSGTISSGTRRVVVVYRHSMFRDLAVRVLRDAGIWVLAVPIEELVASTLPNLRPDVVVLDGTVEDEQQQSAVGELGRETLLSGHLEGLSKVITFDLAASPMLVCSRRQVPLATPQDLVQEVVSTRRSDAGSLA